MWEVVSSRAPSVSRLVVTVIVLIGVYNLGFHNASILQANPGSLTDSGNARTRTLQDTFKRDTLATIEYPKYTAEQEIPEFLAEDEDFQRGTESERGESEEVGGPDENVVICKDGYINAEYLFSDAEDYRRSELWSNPMDSLTPKQYKFHHWATQVYEKFYRKFPVPKHIPRLKTAITPEQFQDCFMNFGRPVIIPFGVVRSLGFEGKGYSLEEYMEVHPDRGEKIKYKANSLHKGKLVLGPALSALKEDAKKLKMGAFRNFPRNLKLTPDHVQQLGLNFPPYHNFRKSWQLSTMFMGSTTADTPNHSDCCDNFISHIVGVKRWILAPPQHTRYQKPKCYGGLCWGACKLPRNPRESGGRKCEGLDYITVDVHEGEMLFLPAAWFHAVYNMGATVMMNNWVSRPPSAVYTNQTGLTGGRGSRKNLKCSTDDC